MCAVIFDQWVQGDMQAGLLMHVSADHGYGTCPKKEVLSFLPVTFHHQSLPWTTAGKIQSVDCSLRNLKVRDSLVAPAMEDTHEVRNKTSSRAFSWSN